MVDRSRLLARLSRRAALRAGTAAGTAAVLGTAANTADAQPPTPPPASPGLRNFRNDPVGGPVSLPTNPEAVRNASLLGLLLADIVRTKGPGPQETELLRRINRIMAKDFARGGRGQGELAVAVLTRAVERFDDFQRGQGKNQSPFDPVTLQFQIRSYTDPNDQDDDPEDILSIEVKSDIPMPPGMKNESPISTIAIVLT